MVGQQWEIQLESIFQYELSSVPSSIIDEYGCLRKGSKAVLLSHLGIPYEKGVLHEKTNLSGDEAVADTVPSPDVVLIDAQQLLNHITWPHEGTAANLVDSMKHKMLKYSDSDKILVFDKYEDGSANIMRESVVEKQQTNIN